ncbi:hypothetical protein GF386_05590 [Candidatus Pacearchaeota archaeon]|nr:hypothetical protein [Candidatus Pacearchaeota archaeon]
MKKYVNKLKSILGLGLSLAKANFKLRNEGSFLGIFWYLLEPLLLFAVILGVKVFFISGDFPDYPMYLLLGLIIYNFFTRATTRSTDLITNNSNFIKSMKINHESLVVSAVLENVFSHFFEILLFIGFMIFFKASLIWILIYPLIFVFFFLFVLGISFLLSTGGVYINDLQNVWRIIARLLFFITPIFYVIIEKNIIYYINLFNPLFYFLEISRDIIIYHQYPGFAFLLIAGIISLSFFFIGIFIFRRFKNKFAEMV